ncbi:MAG: hypothetical protein ACUVWR_10080 [Anaerolineae bacterium]
MTSLVRQLPLFAVERGFKERKVRSVTFKGNFDYPVHRWFRLTPSFSPELVGDTLSHWQLPVSAKVLDPFCGVGTTPLVCQERGMGSCGVELNPLLHFVARVKTTSGVAPSHLATAAQEVASAAQRLFAGFEQVDTQTFVLTYHDYIPRIRNVTKWWSPLVLKKLVALRIAVKNARILPATIDFLQLAIVSILIEVSNARHNHPSLSFAKTSRGDALVFEKFIEQAQIMASDLRAFPHERPPAQIMRGNSKYLETVLPPGSGFDAVITSPPYPNRYSYARETRPQLFFMDLVQNSREVGNLEVQSIGGTWGKATSVLCENIPYRSEVVKGALRGIPDQVAQYSHLMRNYIVKYFNDMEQHIESLKPFLRVGARLAYVIGNSKFYEIALPSDEILADIFEANGFQVDSVERMRRRNSKSGLYEAIVFMGI